MKKIIILFCLISATMFAQDELVLRHIKGIKSIDASIGKTKPGICFDMNYLQYESNKISWQIGLNYEKATIGYTKAKYYEGTAGINYTPFNVKSRLFVNLNVGAHLGANKIDPWTSSDATFVYAGETKFLYGAYAGVTPELFLNNSTSIILSAKQFWTPKDMLGAWKYELSAGIRITLQ